MDSNPLELMTPDTRQTMRNLLKTGITGDPRWLQNEGQQPLPSDDFQWHCMAVYAHQEHVADVIHRGLRLLRIEAPDYHPMQDNCFLPTSYQSPQTIGSVIGMQFVSENERLIATFRQIRRLIASRQLSIAHLVELDRELRQHSCDEALLAEQLHDESLYRMACRTMQLMHELTGLDEGFMPVPPLADRRMRSIRRQMERRLAI